jgi:hypothetical protein
VQRLDATMCLKVKLQLRPQAMKRILLATCLALLMVSCYWRDSEPFIGNVKFDGTGYRPVYKNSDEIARVEVSPAQSLKEPGKIYTYDRYLFINELGQGIHIVDNADPKRPENLSFISIIGNYDIAVKGNWLYADNLSNLLVIDITDPKAPKLTKTIPNAIPIRDFPPLQGIYFECADSKKGIVVDWEKVPMDKQPKCYR